MSPELRAAYDRDMASALESKLFFLGFVNQLVTRYVDFGCGDGKVLEAVGERSFYRCPDLIGIDASAPSVPAPIHRLVGGLDKLAQRWLRDKPNETCLILSSVLHEVLTDEGRLDVLPVPSLKPRFIAIRDMVWANGWQGRVPDSTVEKLRAMGSAPQLHSFAEKWGDLRDWKSATHWCLKVPYAQNWQHELREDYLAVDPVTLHMWLRWMGYTVTHCRHFTPWPVQERLNEYEVSLPHDTHMELVAELCPTPSS